MIHVGRQQLVELSIEFLLEAIPLGPILLDKVRALDRCRKVGLETSVWIADGPGAEAQP